MSDDSAPKLDAYPEGGLSQRLVKSWRLPNPVQIRDTEYSCHVYVCPRTGVFYARVPEQETGSLITSWSLVDLRHEVRDAMKAWVDRASGLERDARVWERMIRIRYSSASQVVGALITAEPDNLYAYGRYVMRKPVDVEPSVRIGTFTFSRYERSLTPDGVRYDERETEEDFQARLQRWRDTPAGRHSRLTKEEHREFRPRRAQSRSWADGSAFSNRGRTRVIPYDDHTWAQLNEFAQRFSDVHNALEEFLLSLDQDRFIEALQSNRLLAMHDDDPSS